MAFRHKSVSITLPDGRLMNNERLEFLGDAILSAIIAEYLFDKFPNGDEGFLTEMRSKMVSRERLNYIAQRIGLRKLIQSNIRGRSANHFGNTFEAVIGAIFMDVGFKKTRKVLIRGIVEKHIDLNALKNTDTNFKSKIIEWGQKSKNEVNFQSFQKYPDAKSPIFVSNLFLGEKIIGTGEGNSKKESEQRAAEEAIAYLDI